MKGLIIRLKYYLVIYSNISKLLQIETAFLITCVRRLFYALQY